MNILCTDHDTSLVDQQSGSGLCGICDNPVECHDIGIATHRHSGTHYAYLVHASCLQAAWDDEEED